MKRDYYVYGWVRLDRNEFIYIEKGKGNRAEEALDKLIFILV